MTKWRFGAGLACALVVLFASGNLAAQEVKNDDDPGKKVVSITQAEWDAVKTQASDAVVKGDSAWMLTSSALVMLMVPGLALFYCGMVRRKNVLATMMHSMVALAVVGVYWVAFGYGLAFGDPWIKIGDGSVLGWSSGLLFLKDVGAGTLLPNSNIPVYLHMLFQGMFAIITPALISGAIAERIRFLPYCLFLVVWVTVVYCPLAHMVWALDWNWANTLLTANINETLLSESGKNAVGYLGKMGALDFAGGTVVHIAAGFSSLAAILVLRRRLGYPQQAFHPNSLVLTLVGAGLLWFGWFGFNGGSAIASGAGATSAFAATQAAAAAAGLSWMVAEWLYRGKPTALGLASGIVAGLVAVTPASGFVTVLSGMIIGLAAGVVCYAAVTLKSLFGYDDSLDAFGVHGIGGFLGAVLTGVFFSRAVNSAVGETATIVSQVSIQFVAAVVSAVLALILSLVVVKVIDLVVGFATSDEDEIAGLDRTEHGESGFDFGLASESTSTAYEAEPRPALIPPTAQGRFQVVVEGVSNGDLMHAWNELCQPGSGAPNEFKAVYPYVTTVLGNRFQFRGGPKEQMRDNLQRLFQGRLNAPIKVKVEG